MIEKLRKKLLIEKYIAPAVADKKVIKAFEKISRHQFVPKSLREFAYEDYPLAIGEGQTISQPSLVAKMTEALEVGKADKVLEIGTGSGYQAAILANLAGEVFTIERLAPLYEKAKKILAKFPNVHPILGDGYQGYAKKAPFAAIIVTAAAPEIPKALEDQLQVGGRLIIPVTVNSNQILIKGVKKAEGMSYEELEIVSFVPLVRG